MVWPVAVSQTKKHVLHRWPGGERREVIEMRPARSFRDERPCDGTAARRFGGGIIYFLRSLRFQQAVSLAAFSLVIGIRVVYIDPFTDPGFTPEETSHLIMPAMSAACVGTRS